MKTSPKNNSSGFKGVYWRKNKGFWYAHLRFNKKSVYLGSFGDSKELAARAYDAAAKRYFGEFAVLNFPNE